MKPVLPVTLAAGPIRLVPLTLDHVPGLQAAAADDQRAGVGQHRNRIFVVGDDLADAGGGEAAAILKDQIVAHGRRGGLCRRGSCRRGMKRGFGDG